MQQQKQHSPSTSTAPPPQPMLPQQKPQNHSASGTSWSSGSTNRLDHLPTDILFQICSLLRPSAIFPLFISSSSMHSHLDQSDGFYELIFKLLCTKYEQYYPRDVSGSAAGSQQGSSQPLINWKSLLRLYLTGRLTYYVSFRNTAIEASAPCALRKYATKLSSCKRKIEGNYIALPNYNSKLEVKFMIEDDIYDALVGGMRIFVCHRWRSETNILLNETFELEHHEEQRMDESYGNEAAEDSTVKTLDNGPDTSTQLMSSSSPSSQHLDSADHAAHSPQHPASTTDIFNVNTPQQEPNTNSHQQSTNATTTNSMAGVSGHHTAVGSINGNGGAHLPDSPNDRSRPFIAECWDVPLEQLVRGYNVIRWRTTLDEGMSVRTLEEAYGLKGISVFPIL